MRSKLRASRAVAATAVVAALAGGGVFWRAERARGTPGSGLGLAIVRQVADQHGATITVETPADGGTTMRLRFPS